jgi:hypothetical protein
VHYHQALKSLAFKYYPHDYLNNPANCGPGQEFVHTDDMQKHFRNQVSQMTSSQRDLFLLYPTVLQPDLESHNEMKLVIVERIQNKIHRIVDLIRTSPDTADMLTIIHSKVNINIQAAMRRMHNNQQKEERKKRVDVKPAPSPKKKLVKKAEMKDPDDDDEKSIDDNVSDISEYTIGSCSEYSHYNGNEDRVLRKDRVPVVNDLNDFQVAVEAAMRCFKPLYDLGNGEDFVVAIDDVPVGADFQMTGDRILTERDLHVKLRNGIQVSANEYIVPSLVSERYSILSVGSHFLSMFAYCRTTSVYESANATVNRDGMIFIRRPVHIGEELIIFNAHPTQTVRDAQCSQLALDLAGVIYNEILSALEDNILLKRKCKADCRYIQNKIKTHRWDPLLNLCAYHKTIPKASENDIALCDIVDSVIGRYKCDECHPGYIYDGYEHFPAWKRHLNFRSLRALYNIDTFKDRGVWRYFETYLKYHRLMKKRNIYYVGVTADPTVQRFYSTDCEYLLKLPSRSDEKKMEMDDEEEDDEKDNDLKRKSDDEINGSPAKRSATEEKGDDVEEEEELIC